MRKRVLATGILMVAVLLTMFSSFSPSWAAPETQGVQRQITYPTSGTTVSGVIEIRGTATHSNLDSYQVRYAPGRELGEMNWVDIVIFVREPVQDGVLCTWDTTTVPDGPYVLALAVWGVDDPANPWTYFVENVIVDNTNVQPTPTLEPTAAGPLPTAAAGPTATAVSVQQPATPTPRSSPTPGLGEETATPEVPVEEEQDRFRIALDSERLRRSFLTGGLVVAMLFVLWGLYVLAKAVVRWYLRQGARIPLRRK